MSNSAHKPRPTMQQITALLAEQHAEPVTDIEPLSGGFWSSAFGYRLGREAYVLRLGDMREGFDIDKAAMRFATADLPVPEVIHVGEALGRYFAISRRHYGRFIETTDESKASAVGSVLETLLHAMRTTLAKPNDAVVWYSPETTQELTWRGWLLSGLKDNSEAHASGWRSKLAADARLDALFNRCETRINELLPICPERRDLIHGDLLHQNVLVAADVSRATAIFSWKCSALGDFLFDVAWCTFWGDWHPAIAQADMWGRALRAPDLSAADLEDAPLRHHCYELQIAASHLGWCAWIDDDKSLQEVAAAAERLLNRGPRSMLTT